MHEFIFATHNANKVREIHALLGDKYKIISLEEAGFDEEIPEPFDTLEANARTKSSTIYQQTGKDCFSEDTGLEVEALDGAPGVRSARYAGEQKSARDNVNLLLQNMQGEKNRKACFRTVFSLFLDGKEYQFEGKCPGNIAEETAGEGGFGYDPVFIPEGADITFASMTMQEKNKFSHRAKAFGKLVEFLKAQ